MDADRWQQELHHKQLVCPPERRRPGVYAGQFGPERHLQNRKAAVCRPVRQNVDWSSDSNTIKRELAFVEAYLSLQKYRFGERLSYQINAQEDCQNILVPKLTITTFVENACVHGIEAKSFPGWIFVRVYTENDALCMEIEDTGGGMDEAEVERIQDRMRNASLKMLKEKGRVGMVNTCLRIRMMTEDTAQFSVESEPGIGTLVSIRFPLNKAIRAE